MVYTTSLSVEGTHIILPNIKVLLGSQTLNALSPSYIHEKLIGKRNALLLQASSTPLKTMCTSSEPLEKSLSSKLRYKNIQTERLMYDALEHITEQPTENYILDIFSIHTYTCR